MAKRGWIVDIYLLGVGLLDNIQRNVEYVGV